MEDIDINILGILLKTRNEKSNILIITESYMKYAQVVTLSTVNADVIAAAVHHAWVFPLGLPTAYWSTTDHSSPDPFPNTFS